MVQLQKKNITNPIFFMVKIVYVSCDGNDDVFFPYKKLKTHNETTTRVRYFEIIFSATSFGDDVNIELGEGRKDVEIILTRSLHQQRKRARTP